MKRPAEYYEKMITLKSGEQVALRTETISAEEYIDFLKRSDLGKQYPQEDFQQRIAVLVKNIQISLIARSKQDQVIGICFGLTDFAYWLFITDLGTDRNYVKLWLGRELMNVSHQIAGGENKIIVFAYANENAIPFYQNIGMQLTQSMMIKDNIEWTEFVVK